nr:uncharacterized protein LOC129257845 [Lytechinus pictus]
MDTDGGDPITENGPTPVSSPVLESQESVIPVGSDEKTITDLLVGLRMAVEDLYASEVLEVRLCFWLVCCLVILWLCIILAWKTYGREIMTVLAGQDKLNRSGSISRESSRQNSAEDASIVTEPPVSKSERWPEHGKPLESSVSAPHHPKTD